MIKKVSATPDAAQRIAKTDFVTRVPADDISQRAYRLFQERGGQHGHDIEDWLLAEAEMVEGQSTEVGPVEHQPRLA